MSQVRGFEEPGLALSACHGTCGRGTHLYSHSYFFFMILWHQALFKPLCYIPER